MSRERTRPSGASGPPVAATVLAVLVAAALSAAVPVAGFARVPVTVAEGQPPGTSAIDGVSRPATTHTALPSARDLSPKPGARHLVLFSVTRCPWCEIVRAKHLRHRLDSRRGDFRIAVSEVRIDRDDPLVGPDGETTTSRALARRLGVKVGPTVVAFDGAGRPVGEPLVGALLEDFYEAYLDRLVDQAAGEGHYNRGK